MVCLSSRYVLGIYKRITYIKTPENIRNQYQYFTKAEMSKLRKVGFKDKFISLEDGINDYVMNLEQKYSDA